MKFKICLLVYILTFSSYGQDIKTCNKKLKEAFEKLDITQIKETKMSLLMIQLIKVMKILKNYC